MNTRPPRRVFVSLGSNLGDRSGFLAAAREALSLRHDTTVVAASGVYETAPQGLADQPEFLNQVVCLETLLEPRELLVAIQGVEAAQGRSRGPRFGPRTLDIDILLFEGVESGDPDLTIPHPRMGDRAFVMVPLAEVWGWARGMPALDVAALAKAIAGAQAVRPSDTSEA